MDIAGATPSHSPHILIFPYPAQGHMLSLLDLTHQLALRGLTLTIVVTPKNLPSLTPLLSAHPSAVHALVLPFPPHPDIPPGVENLKDLPADGFKYMMVALAGLHDPIVNWFNDHPSPPSAIVSDMFLGWTHRLAGRLGIRRYVFCPSGAFGISVVYSLWRYQPKRDDPGNDDVLVSFPEIPNSPVYPWWQLSPMYRRYVEGDPVSEFIKDVFLDNMLSWGLVINSFTELERVYFDHLKHELGHDRVFAVGPLLPTANARGGSSLSEIQSWLDTCTNKSVMYVCFGSQAVLTNSQMAAVANGLEKSEVKFLWAVKGPTVGHVAEEYGLIPPGFEDRTTGRGIVVRGWAPQVEILSHDSVGVFLTHCGWNSVLEAVAAGVVMLTWPMGADQYTDAKLVHELRLGVRACEGDETVPDSDELAQLFRKSVSEEMGVERDRVMEFANAAKKAVEENGSSWKELNGFINLSN